MFNNIFRRIKIYTNFIEFAGMSPLFQMNTMKSILVNLIQKLTDEWEVGAKRTMNMVHTDRGLAAPLNN